MAKVIGFHIICCTYGFWLPNDERGSGSDFVRSDALARFGPAHPVSDRRSVARKPFDFEVRRMARSSLLYPHVEFTNSQIGAIGRGVEREITRLTPAAIYAFAQLRDHFHLVSGPCRYDVRAFAGRIKGAATKQLIQERLHPLNSFQDRNGHAPSPWSVKPWIIYLFSDGDVIRCINYSRENLERARMEQQQWSFIVPYRGT
jgi:hypothetical protein